MKKYSRMGITRYFQWMRVIVVLLVASLLIQCTDKLQVVEEYHANGELMERFAVNSETGKKDGDYSRYSEDGVLVETAIYRDGKLHGERKLYYPNGNVELIERYVDGTFEGPYSYFYEDGSLELEGDYRSGSMEGVWKKYYKGGQLMESVEFAGNEENGPFVEYYENGNLKAEGSYYKGDNEHGLLKLYDESGSLYKKMECDSGICHTTWERADSNDLKSDTDEG